MAQLLGGALEALSPLTSLFQAKPNYPPVEFWKDPERVGLLWKQTNHLKLWRKRWFVLKAGHIFWFMPGSDVTPQSVPRGWIEVKTCLSVKGAEDALNMPHAFEISTNFDTMYYRADSDKEKEDWINAIGRAIVRHSSSLCEEAGGY